jgi:hypothetical protein
VDKFEQLADGCDPDHAETTLGELIVAGGDGAVDLTMTEHVLDAVDMVLDLPRNALTPV